MELKRALSLSDAHAIAAAARAKAVENHWNVVIAILDEGGHLMLLERADHTQVGSVQVAQEKARTAFLFRRSTKVMEETVVGGRVVMLNLPGNTPVEGGVPLFSEGQLVGAIGVSGVQSFQDGIIAAAGAEVVERLTLPA
jgi:uncharacterized protein GlcG (DUF336 family)